ncbi:MAG: hypothetical protein QM730_20535 [Anaerolineales bacterium]
MPKQFYTEHDIEDMVRKGIKSLQVTDDVVLTELAYEKAKKLDLQLVSVNADNPPAAPVRPYLSEKQTASPSRTMPSKPVAAPVTQTVSQPTSAAPRVLPIEQRIRSAVLAKLGDQVDAKLLDNIIHRVVKGIGLK